MRGFFLLVQALIDELEEFKEKYDLRNVKKQYEELKSAIPKEWLNEIQKGEKKEGKVEVYLTNQDNWMELRSGNVKMFSKAFREEVFKNPIQMKCG